MAGLPKLTMILQAGLEDREETLGFVYVALDAVVRLYSRHRFEVVGLACKLRPDIRLAD